MKLLVLKDTTSKSVDVFIRDSSVTTGAGLAGLVFDSGGLTAYYRRPGGSATAITLVTLANAQAAFSSGGFVAVDGTNMPGVYRLDIPNAVLATGVNDCVIMLKGAANMEPCVMEIQLTSFNPNDAVRAGLSALPNAAAEAAAGLYTRGTGVGQINQPANGRIAVDSTHIDGVAATNLRRSYEASTLVTVGAASTSTVINTDLTEVTSEHFKGLPLYFLTGVLAKQIVEVTGYNGTTKALTVTASPTGESPAAGDLALLG